MQRLERKDDQGSRYDFACEIKLAVADDAKDGAIEGYGAVFNLMDRGGDIILPGAFAKSLNELQSRGGNVPMLWQHRTSEPIGVWNALSEDSYGLKVAGELILDVPQASAARALLRRKAINGLSIGYITRDADIDRQTGVRRIKELELFEISLVTMPMMPEAIVSDVKAWFDDKKCERAMRDAGLSIRESKIATSVVRKMSFRDGGKTEPASRDGVTDVLLELRKAKKKAFSA